MDKDKLNIILRAKNGDKNALIKLIKLEENNIYSTLIYLNRDSNELTDIAQNVFIKLTSKINTLKNPLYFKTWLNRIIVNTYYDYMRALKRKSGLINEEEISKNIQDSALTPLNGILKKELDNIIKNSIKKLPNHYKIPITLREIQGLSYEDISSITNVSIGTVKSRISRARGIIKNDINNYQNDK